MFHDNNKDNLSCTNPPITFTLIPLLRRFGTNCDALVNAMARIELSQLQDVDDDDGREGVSSDNKSHPLQITGIESFPQCEQVGSETVEFVSTFMSLKWTDGKKKG